MGEQALQDEVLTIDHRASKCKYWDFIQDSSTPKPMFFNHSAILSPDNDSYQIMGLKRRINPCLSILTDMNYPKKYIGNEHWPARHMFN